MLDINRDRVVRNLKHLPIKNQPGTFMIFGHHKSGLSDYLNHFYSFDVMINLQNPDTLRKLIADKDLYFLKNILQSENIQSVLIENTQLLQTDFYKLTKHINEKKIKIVLTSNDIEFYKHNLLNADYFYFPYLTLFELSLIEDFNKVLLRKAILNGFNPQVFTKDFSKAQLDQITGFYFSNLISIGSHRTQIHQWSKLFEYANNYNHQILNCERLAKSTLIPSRTVRSYVNKLTNLSYGFLLPGYKFSSNKGISSSKFYFYDPGIADSFSGSVIDEKDHYSLDLRFKNLMVLEIYKFILSLKKNVECFHFSWNRYEIDFLVLDHEKNQLLAFQFIFTEHLHEHHFKNNGFFQKLFLENFDISKSLELKNHIVSMDQRRMNIQNILNIDLETFLNKLWKNELF